RARSALGLLTRPEGRVLHCTIFLSGVQSLEHRFLARRRSRSRRYGVPLPPRSTVWVVCLMESGPAPIAKTPLLVPASPGVKVMLTEQLFKTTREVPQVLFWITKSLACVPVTTILDIVIGTA